MKTRSAKPGIVAKRLRASDPLDALLRRLACGASDAAVRSWAAALIRGESAAGRPSAGADHRKPEAPKAAQGGRHE